MTSSSLQNITVTSSSYYRSDIILIIFVIITTDIILILIVIILITYIALLRHGDLLAVESIEGASVAVGLHDTRHDVVEKDGLQLRNVLQ